MSSATSERTETDAAATNDPTPSSSAIGVGIAPNNGVVRRPTFLFIGADRCGSKSLHRIFAQHPACYVPRIADPYFFDKNYERGFDWYWSLFAPAPPSVEVIGEFSHDYIHSPVAAERIARDLPGVKLMATLRHPIERTLSSYGAGKSSMVIRGTFEQALADYPMLIENSLYADRLEPYLRLFPREDLKLMLFDDLEADAPAFAAEAFSFVGLPSAEGIDYRERMNVLWKSRFPLSGPLTKLAANTLRKLGWVDLLGRLKGNPKFRALFRKPTGADERPTIAPATRQRLREVFAPQIDRLETLIDRDLSHWRT